MLYVLITKICPNSSNDIRSSVIFVFLKIIFLELSESFYSCFWYPMTSYIPSIFHHIHPGDTLCLFLKGRQSFFWIPCLPFSWLLPHYSTAVLQKFPKKKCMRGKFFEALEYLKMSILTLDLSFV